MSKTLRRGWIAFGGLIQWMRHYSMSTRGLTLIPARLIAVLCGFGMLGLPSARASVLHDCDKAAQLAASETGVPLAVMRAITRAETGRNDDGSLTPWPWTVNMNGRGIWFDSNDAAEAYVQREILRGARSFDVGCFQINYKWHGAAFRSIQHMLDPVENARYAAQFLWDLHLEMGDWSLAAGAYHSRHSEFAGEYRKRFDRILANLHDMSNPVPDLDVISWTPEPKSAVSENSFPLLHTTGSQSRNGSLVPIPETKDLRTFLDRIAFISF
jgi:hypothetical protein